MLVGLGIATIVCVWAIAAANNGFFEGEKIRKESHVIMEDIKEEK